MKLLKKLLIPLIALSLNSCSTYTQISRGRSHFNTILYTDISKEGYRIIAYDGIIKNEFPGIVVYQEGSKTVKTIYNLEENNVANFIIWGKTNKPDSISFLNRINYKKSQ